jgi:ubiquitin carboxyl-terminal hydrolase 8
VLKRFHYAGPWRDKLNTFVDFPMQNLDLTSYALAGQNSQSEKSEKYLYDLYGVTNHFGTLSGGHCSFRPRRMLIGIDTACIHNNLRGKWYSFDDSRVSPCDDTSVVVIPLSSTKAYSYRDVPHIFYGIRGTINFKTGIWI